jgi:hypothetical protein
VAVREKLVDKKKWRYSDRPDTSESISKLVTGSENLDTPSLIGISKTVCDPHIGTFLNIDLLNIDLMKCFLIG